MATIIEAKNLYKYFDTPHGKLHAVDDVSFTIEEGTTLGVVGESGCGKSTLGRTMIHLLESTGGQIIFNERDSRVTDRIRAIAGLFDRAGIWYEISSDILHDMWWKFAFNIIVNSLSAVMRLDYSQMNDNNAFRRLVRMLYHEIRAVALSEGIRLTVDDEERCFAVLGSMNGRGKTSMLQDVEAGRETENRFFAGSLSALGKKHSLPTPLCDMLYTMVEAASGACRE